MVIIFIYVIVLIIFKFTSNIFLLTLLSISSTLKVTNSSYYYLSLFIYLIISSIFEFNSSFISSILGSISFVISILVSKFISSFISSSYSKDTEPAPAVSLFTTAPSYTFLILLYNLFFICYYYNY